MQTEIKKTRIKIGGMTCANCASGIKKHLEKNTEYVIGDNEPYRIDDKDFTVPQHAVERSLPSVLIEIRQDLVETVEGQISWASFIAEALSEAKKIL